MNLRDIFVSVGCCAAAVCLGFGKPARAAELQSSNVTAPRAPERCAALQPGVAAAKVTSGCERIGGHVRVDLGSRMSNPSGYSPVAVRLGEGTPSRGHLRLPASESGLDQFAR